MKGSDSLPIGRANLRPTWHGIASPKTAGLHSCQQGGEIPAESPAREQEAWPQRQEVLKSAVNGERRVLPRDIRFNRDYSKVLVSNGKICL